MTNYLRNVHRPAVNLRGTALIQTIELANPKLISLWRWNFEDVP